MSQPSPQSDSAPERSQGDPWQAFGYVVSGVGLYGVLGWLADRWLGTSFLVAVGILVGAGLGLYMTFARFTPTHPRETPEAPGPGSAPAASRPKENG